MDRAINNNDQRMIGGTFVFGYVINSLQFTIMYQQTVIGTKMNHYTKVVLVYLVLLTDAFALIVIALCNSTYC